MYNDWLGGDQIEGADGAEGETTERESTWPEEGSACQETNKHPAPQGRERPVEADLMGLPASSLPRLLRLFMNFTMLTLFYPLFLPSFPFISAKLAGLRLTEQDAEHYHRRLLHISIKVSLSGRPHDLPWRAGEEAGRCTASRGMDTVHSHV